MNFQYFHIYLEFQEIEWIDVTGWKIFPSKLKILHGFFSARIRKYWNELVTECLSGVSQKFYNLFGEQDDVFILLWQYFRFHNILEQSRGKLFSLGQTYCYAI